MLLGGFGLSFYLQIGSPGTVRAGTGPGGANIAPITGDFRSVKSGNWDDITVWQKYSGGWVAAIYFPTSADKNINIRTGHTVTIRTIGVIISQVCVETGAILDVISGASFILKIEIA